MNIHIVHLPHTYPFLIDLSLAFYKYGFETVTLVANGFNQDEIKGLNTIANKYSFIKILDVPTKRILSHGQALNYAFERSNEELFCFADHDIFPTKAIIEDIMCSLNNHDVVCLGDRPENISADYKGFAASATSTQSGVPLATSFFSIYKSSVINHVRTHYGVGFEQYFRRSQIPESLVQQQDIQNLNEPFLIDTCKAMSLALYQLDKKISHLAANNVCHLGGLCGAINRFINNNKTIIKVFEVKRMPSTPELEEYYAVNQQRHPKVLELKRSISDYSLQLLMALQNNQEPPEFITNDEILSKAVAQIFTDTSNIFS
jgi:glycosyltransferase involved in cell wall biosynthesis